VLAFERLPAPTPLHSEGVLPPLPPVPKGHPFPALAALSRLEVYLHLARVVSPADPEHAALSCLNSPHEQPDLGTWLQIMYVFVAPWRCTGA
jgi:hypothetical protein